MHNIVREDRGRGETGAGLGCARYWSNKTIAEPLQVGQGKNVQDLAKLFDYCCGTKDSKRLSQWLIKNRSVKSF